MKFVHSPRNRLILLVIVAFIAIFISAITGTGIAAPTAWIHASGKSPLSTPQIFISPLPIPRWARPKPLINDAFAVPHNILQLEKTGVLASMNGGYAPSPVRTSDYMLGSVTVAIILPESDGSLDPNLENWTVDEINKVRQEVSDGLTWWKTKAQARGINLNFIIASGHPIVVPTKYEPITRRGGGWNWNGEEGLWVDDVMERLGYNSYPLDQYQLEVRKYDHDLRQTNYTDWAFTIFVADSSNDADGLFSNFISAYAWVAGPHIVLTRDNDGYTFEEMDGVLVHEIGHLFGSPDEEMSDACVNSNSCQQPFGYLNVPNQNCNLSVCALHDGNCIMRAPQSNLNLNTICQYTAGHVGWRDSDSDSLPDPIDTVPQLSISGYPANPSASYILNYTAKVTDLPYSTTQPDYISVTINTVSVQYQIGSPSGTWATTIAGDGAWDSSYEENFRIPIFQNGTYQIYIRGINEVNHTSAIMNYTVTINSTDPVYKVRLPLMLRN